VSFKNVSDIAAMFDKLISQSEVVVLPQGGKVVIKRFSKEVGKVKWFPIATVLKVIYPFELSPEKRLQRELKFFSNSWSLFKTPKVLDSNLQELTITREYVEGRIPDLLRDAEVLANALAEIHNSCWALGDVKHTNFIVTKENILYVVDAEQSIEKATDLNKAWDILLLTLIASYNFITSPQNFSEFISNFLNRYATVNHRSKEILNSLNDWRLSGLYLLMPISHTTKFNAAVKEVLKNI